VQNFLMVFLPESLFTRELAFLTPSVDTYSLIMNTISSLSTIL